MDVRFINPFLKATEKVFERMVNTQVSLGRTMATRGLSSDPNFVNAVVEMHGEVEGVVVLRFPLRVVYSVAEAFAGSSVDEADAHDAIGELANMVAGGAKQHLYGRFATLSIPRVIQGNLSGLPGAGDAPWLTMFLSCGVGDFQVAVNLVMSPAMCRD
jgi:chemotaxis protein CheX